ncbi:hypothetical protein PR048_027578 [Dryococelus australis]|uniref:Uncharacterized protein n=1 Tax=Dryococelus australis TaxID=614101 RepID=A0ABQ9GGY0_9NEOP|nr:hypothetical protein PR048_027578 [Dryococelus australis]
MIGSQLNVIKRVDKKITAPRLQTNVRLCFFAIGRRLSSSHLLEDSVPNVNTEPKRRPNHGLSLGQQPTSEILMPALLDKRRPNHGLSLGQQPTSEILMPALLDKRRQNHGLSLGQQPTSEILMPALLDKRRPNHGLLLGQQPTSEILMPALLDKRRPNHGLLLGQQPISEILMPALLDKRRPNHGLSLGQQPTSEILMPALLDKRRPNHGLLLGQQPTSEILMPALLDKRRPNHGLLLGQQPISEILMPALLDKRRPNHGLSLGQQPTSEILMPALLDKRRPNHGLLLGQQPISEILMPALLDKRRPNHGLSLGQQPTSEILMPALLDKRRPNHGLLLGQQPTSEILMPALLDKRRPNHGLSLGQQPTSEILMPALLDKRRPNHGLLLGQQPTSEILMPALLDKRRPNHGLLLGQQPTSEILMPALLDKRRPNHGLSLGQQPTSEILMPALLDKRRPNHGLSLGQQPISEILMPALLCWTNEYQGARLPPRRSALDARRVHSRIFACRNRAGRCRLLGAFIRVLLFPPTLAFQLRSILGSHFMSCPGMTGTYGSQLESPSLGECCLALTKKIARPDTVMDRRGSWAGAYLVGDPFHVSRRGHWYRRGYVVWQASADRRRGGSRLPPPLTQQMSCSFQRDKTDVKHVYTEVDCAIRSRFIRHALDDSEPLTDSQGNNLRVLFGSRRDCTVLYAFKTPSFAYWSLRSSEAFVQDCSTLANTTLFPAYCWLAVKRGVYEQLISKDKIRKFVVRRGASCPHADCLLVLAPRASASQRLLYYTRRSAKVNEPVPERSDNRSFKQPASQCKHSSNTIVRVRGSPLRRRRPWRLRPARVNGFTKERDSHAAP